MATLSNFGEQFAARVLEKTYQNAVFDAIVNRDYEGEIKKPGDRVNILSFLNAGELNDYVVGTDMTVGNIIDTEDQLVVTKRKYYNFSLDRIEDVFAYAQDIPDKLIEEHQKVLERTIDTYVLDLMAQSVKAGSWVGVDLFVRGSGQTQASLVTSATGGTITVSTNVVNGGDGNTGPSPWENPRDGNTYMAGFDASDLYKGIRLVSTQSFVSPWYRISGVTNTMVVTVTEWDQATSGPDFEEGYTLRGTWGGDGISFAKYNAVGGASLIGMTSLGWEIQAAAATSVTKTTIYPQTTILAQYLDDNEVTTEGRKLVVPPGVVTMLKQASELQPSGIAEIYTGTILNGRTMRLGGFDIHQAAGSRLSTRAGHFTDTSNFGSDMAATAGATGYLMPAVNTGFMTYADKWSESRVVDAENQFAKKYQGLFLFGAKVPVYRSKYASMLFGSF